MKRILFTISFLLITLFASAQYFEGKVVYHNTYKSKTPSLTDEQLASMMGSTQNWYIQEGNYKSETNGTFSQWQLYINQDNKLYSKMANSVNVLYNDASINNNEITNVQLNAGSIEILGYKCDELILTTKTGTQKYYFSNKLPVNTKLFVNHKFGDWYAYLLKSNAVPLKMIIEMPQLTLVSIAAEVKPMKLEKALFTLPAGRQVVKSPY